MATDTRQQELKGVEEAIESAIKTVWKCSIMIENGFDATDKSIEEQTQNFHTQINQFLNDLHVLDQQAQKVHHINIPDSVIAKVDEGQNPDLVTRNELMIAQEKNNQTRGRLFSTQVYADQLEARLNHWNLSQQLQEEQSQKNAAAVSNDVKSEAAASVDEQR